MVEKHTSLRTSILSRKISLGSLALRSLALIGQLSASMVIAARFPPGDVTQFGVIVGSVNLAVFLLGLEIYNVSFRDVSRRPIPKVIEETLARQAGVHSAVYGIAAVSVGVCHLAGLVPSAVLPVIILAPLAHASHEGFRVLIAMHRPIVGNMTLAIRQGLPFAIFAGLSLLLGSDRLSLSHLWAMWGLACLTSIVVVYISLRKADVSLRVRLPPDFSVLSEVRWLALHTICIRAMLVVDLYYVGALVTPIAADAYVFFATLLGAYLALFDAAVTHTQGPGLIRSERKKEDDRTDRRRRFFVESLQLVVGGIVAYAVVVPAIIDVVGRPAFARHYLSFGLLLVASALMALSQYPHFVLYANGRDRETALGSIAGLITQLLGLATMGPLFGSVGVAAARMFGGASMAAAKGWAIRMSAPS